MNQRKRLNQEDAPTDQLTLEKKFERFAMYAGLLARVWNITKLRRLAFAIRAEAVSFDHLQVSFTVPCAPPSVCETSPTSRP
jgi:hypothetical protein